MFALKSNRHGTYNLILLVQSQQFWEATHNINICEVSEEKAQRLLATGVVHRWPFKDTQPHKYIEHSN